MQEKLLEREGELAVHTQNLKTGAVERISFAKTNGNNNRLEPVLHEAEGGKKYSEGKNASNWKELEPTDYGNLKKETCSEWFIRCYYFPFLSKYKYVVVGLWFVVLILSANYGPGYFSKTRNTVGVLKDSPDQIAIKTFAEFFPLDPNFGWPPVFIVSHLNDPSSQPLSSYESEYQNISKSLQSLLSTYPQVVGNVTGSLSLNGQSGLYTIYLILGQSSVDVVNEMVGDLLKWAQQSSTAKIAVYCTGMAALTLEPTNSMISESALKEGIVLPFALLLLGSSLRSYKHLGLVLLNLICSMLLTFTCLIPVTQILDIDPLTTPFMLTVCSALSFDYGLFIIHRFKEELSQQNINKEVAVLRSLLASGQVILLSGATLFFSFLLLVSFSVGMLKSFGMMCVAVFVTTLCNITLSPAMLLSFESFSSFDLLPFCCKNQKKINKDEDLNKMKNEADLPKRKRGRSLCFTIAYKATSKGLLILIFSCIAAAYMLMIFFSAGTTSDSSLLYLQGSRSLAGLDILNADFNPGAINPYSILCVSRNSDKIFSSKYFDLENKLIHELINNESLYVNAASFTALSFFEGKDISFENATAFLTPGSELYLEGSNYRNSLTELISWNKIAASITINTIVNPITNIDSEFVIRVRSIVDEISNESPASFPLTIYLLGGYTQFYDIQQSVFKLFPIIIACTIVIAMVFIGYHFGSILLAVRLAFTVCISLCLTLGSMSLVYSPGKIQTILSTLNPDLQNSSGIFWMVPVQSFSILIGLALDYDIFLMFRVVEFRKIGWSDRASVCLAVEKTGNIISIAGLIMSVSFAGMLLVRILTLSQFGFNLLIGVLLDTFLVRTILVPVVISLLGNNDAGGLNWWPSKMPPVKLSPKEEELALLEGIWHPDEYFANLAKDECIASTQ